MKTVTIGRLKRPVIQVSSEAEIDKNSEAIQCIEIKDDFFVGHFYHSQILFIAYRKSAIGAAESIAKEVLQYDLDCKIESFFIQGASYPVRSRKTLWDSELGSERSAEFGVIHWWTKGTDGDEYYKCDIHHPDDHHLFSSNEGVGKTLAEALADLSASFE